MSQNPDSVVNQGEFAGHVKPSEPLTTSGVSSDALSVSSGSWNLASSIHETARASYADPVALHTYPVV